MLASRRHFLMGASAAALLTAVPAQALVRGSLQVSNTPLGPLQFVDAAARGPTSAQPAAIPSGAAVTRMMGRAKVIIGSADVSQLIFSFLAWTLDANSGVNAKNGYTVIGAAFEYNGTSKPITFSGGRTLVVNSGDTDIQSDALNPSAYGLTKFAWGSTGWVRIICEFANAATDKFCMTTCPLTSGTVVYRTYDPTKVTVTNGVDSTGNFAYTMTGGGVDGTDTRACGGIASPIVLGRFLGKAASWIVAGDSKSDGTGDTPTSQLISGFSRAFFPDPTSPANAIANINMGKASGIGSDWANGTPSLLTAYLKYATRAVEHYGSNALTTSYSTAIHAQMRAAGIKSILRPGIGPRNSTSTFPISISSLTSVSTTATATVGSTALSHMTSGQSYPISGASPSSYNGTFAISNFQTTTFDYTFAGGTSPATGTIVADDQCRTEFFQTAQSGWSTGGAADNFNVAMQALVASDFTYVDMTGLWGSTRWLWAVNGSAHYSTDDGLHPNAVGYELSYGGSSTVISNSGTTTQTIRNLIASFTT